MSFLWLEFKFAGSFMNIYQSMEIHRIVDGQAEIRVLDEYYLHASEGNVVDLALEAADQRLKVPLSILMISRSGRIRTR
jgi:hypothetical protein